MMKFIAILEEDDRFIGVIRDIENPLKKLDLEEVFSVTNIEDAVSAVRECSDELDILTYKFM